MVQLIVILLIVSFLIMVLMHVECFVCNYIDFHPLAYQIKLCQLYNFCDCLLEITELLSNR